ncbi:MAG: DUF4856 domain-containing protein [Flavobacteriaceae bacterium]|nr:MAG: DUF4856 domain-containing protein [Flavobacteriaceae bacterium]
MLTAVILLSLTSCSNDDDTNTGNPVTAPTTYTFERNGSTSVSFSGQTTRILMAEEIINALKNPVFTEVQIDAMYNHTQGANNFSNTNLNASDKVVRSKTAASFDFFAGSANSSVLTDFDGWIAEQVSSVYPVWNQNAAAGVAGGLQEGGGGSTRYINAKGLELNQVFNKGLIGAMIVDQMLNNYISSNVLGNFEAANDAGTLVTGKNYTDMEHDWDEAFGYLFGTAPDAANPLTNIGTASGQNGDDSFLSKYLDRVNDDPDFNGIANDIYNALKLGRAAIVAKNYTVRNQQAEIIREKVSEVIGVRSVFYLQQAKATLEASSNPDYAAAFHDLSEAFGFIYSLQFTRKPNSNSPYLSRTEVQAILADIYTNNANGFWDVTPAILQTSAEAIAAEFNFTVGQAGSSN